LVNYQQLEDEGLLRLISQQNPDALEELYDRHAQIAYNLIVRIVHDPAIADEILQETFWQVWQKASDFSGRGAVAAWLYRIARNKSLDQLRRQKARPQPVETGAEQEEGAVWSQLNVDSPGVEYVVEMRSTQAQLRQALTEIPEEQRQCLELAYFEGLSQRQIAELTGAPLGTVKTRMRIGLEKLERILQAAGFRARDGY
jgi:RNA polymerase sigma-70 factor (ECF subfamily)